MPNVIHAVVETLLAQLRAGALTPGTQLNETTVATSLGVSRNTLREAFRLLQEQGFLIHRPHRGVFVRSHDAESISELYRARSFLEVAAMSLFDATSPQHQRIQQDMARCIKDAQQAADAGDFDTVASANMEFHQLIFQLPGSVHICELGASLLTHLKLVFVAAGTPDVVHQPYLRANREILELMAEDPQAAAKRLETYLEQSSEQMLHILQASTQS